MIIKLKDGMEVHATIEQAEGAEKAIEAGILGIKINGVWIRSDWIAIIKPGGNTESDAIKNVDRILNRQDFRGKESPAKEALRRTLNK